jgi:hypothetical protein
MKNWHKSHHLKISFDSYIFGKSNVSAAVYNGLHTIQREYHANGLWRSPWTSKRSKVGLGHNVFLITYYLFCFFSFSISRSSHIILFPLFFFCHYILNLFIKVTCLQIRLNNIWSCVQKYILKYHYSFTWTHRKL